MWKQLIALLVRIEDEEGEKYAEHKIWAPAWIRFEKKVLTLNEKVAIEVRRSISRAGGKDSKHAEEVEAGGTASEFHGGRRSGMEYGSGGENKRIREAFEGRRRRGQENDLTITWGNANWRSF